MRILKWAGILIAVAVTLRVFDLSPQKLLEMAKNDLERFDRDTQSLTSGEYRQKVSQSLRDETQGKDMAVVNGDPTGDLQRELSEARKQMLKDRADAVEAKATSLLRGDTETLKRQVRDSAAQAGGGY